MSKHTPSPWELRGTYTIVSSEDEQDICYVTPIDVPAGENRANIDLIRAAPDLLDSNINLASYVRSLGHLDDPTVRALLDMGDEAIAKARGG